MGLIGSNAVRKRLDDAGHGCSLPALRRFGCRPAEDNRFPTPLRDPKPAAAFGGNRRLTLGWNGKRSAARPEVG